MNLFLTVAAGAIGFICANASAATPEDTYKAKCSSCHDAGVAGAPRAGDRDEWARRNRQGTDVLYRTALQGKPDTAMLARGGFTELTDAEVTAANIDDATLVARVRSALAKTKGIHAADIKLEAANGVVTLRGVVDDAAQIKLAEDAAAKTGGVIRIDSKLIAKNMFAWD